MKKREKGITLIALVITIVILLILAGIAIAALTGDNGLFARAKLAKDKTINSQNEENTILEDYEDKIEKIISSRQNELNNSNIIKKAEIEAELNNIEIKVNFKLETTQEMQDGVAVLILNNKLYKTYDFKSIKENNITIIDLKPNTEYEIYVIIIDENGEIVRTESKKCKTGNSVYSWKLLEYPLLTETGMKNAKCVDQYGNIKEYKKDLSMGNCTANDSLPMNAWDGNLETYVTTGTYYFEVSEDMIGKNFTWNQSAISFRTSGFWFLDSNKNEISEKFGWDVSGSRVVQENTKYIKYYTDGHQLWEIPNM